MALLPELPTLAEMAQRPRAEARPPRKTAAERKAGHRDARGWRSAPKVNKFGEPSKAGEIAAEKRHENAVRAETRRKVWKRSDRCEGCGDTEVQTAEKWPKAEHEANEIEMRSKTRNMAPEYRFHTERTARLCVDCHAKFHRKRRPCLSFDFHTELGMDGSYSAMWKRADGTFRAVPNPRDMRVQ